MENCKNRKFVLKKWLKSDGMFVTSAQSSKNRNNTINTFLWVVYSSLGGGFKIIKDFYI